ncbi:competence type IV pilus minor pilin ComGE [Metabacillus litoralis]|uniref:competence type IV pilus minor pilin ComGE n=1 Tax=Metabacillus litoralis TaxID=152268 RepID=UPI001CFD19E9|nr:competence type IV pilus minor pilin ComGE [Metabacillus litoralis]
MRNSKGFSLAETIAAFSLWMLITLLIIPQLVLITKERVNTQQSLAAYKILHEKTQQVTYNTNEKRNEVIKHDGVDYHLSWEEENPYNKACLSWENSSKKAKSVCFLL